MKLFVVGKLELQLSNNNLILRRSVGLTGDILGMNICINYYILDPNWLNAWSFRGLRPLYPHQGPQGGPLDPTRYGLRTVGACSACIPVPLALFMIFLFLFFLDWEVLNPVAHPLKIVTFAKLG